MRVQRGREKKRKFLQKRERATKIEKQAPFLKNF